MLHQWMFWIMLLLCGFRLSGLTFLLVFFYVIHAVSVLLNLIVMKASRPLVVYNTDLIVTGTLFDILISIVLVIEAAVEHQHIRLEPAEPAEPTEPNKSI